MITRPRYDKALLPLLWLAWLIALSVAAGAQDNMIEEKWTAGGLHGTLAKPASDSGRGPAVLIIAGSGPTDRNGNGPLVDTDTYRLIAQGLAAAGIRSLRYDKRGIGESRALVTREEDIVFSDFVGDAVTAARDLAARLDVSAVVIAGHSEGALIGTLAAAQTDVAGLALLTATGRSMRAILTDQLKTGLPPALEAESYRILDALSAGQRISDVSKELMGLFRPSVQPFFISVLRIDPAAELAKVKRPILIMHAGRDLQIFPADFEALRKARPDATVIELPEANHLLKTSPADLAGNRALYRDRTAPLDPGVLPALVDFVRKVAPN